MEVVITLEPGHVADIGEVAGALRAAGLRDAQILEAAGVITGHADDPEPLRLVPGVGTVEVSRTIDIGPPDAPVQ
ncbi:MAG TPA: hypothetical protein VFM58_14985 [Solirubrobacteraceae bacterium]|nr:hypothetical protein [Solirubrobacteraceae bacterium]